MIEGSEIIRINYSCIARRQQWDLLAVKELDTGQWLQAFKSSRPLQHCLQHSVADRYLTIRLRHDRVLLHTKLYSPYKL